MGYWNHAQSAFALASESPQEYVLFPENAFSAWSDSSARAFFADQIDDLSRRGKTIFFGANVASERPALEDNVIEIQGKQSGVYRQRVPIPIGMWGNGYAAHLSGPGVVRLKDSTVVAVLLCYEQLLVLPILQSFAAAPDLVLAPSNLNWARGTTIAKTERVSVASWAGLFHVPYLQAVNQ